MLSRRDLIKSLAAMPILGWFAQRSVARQRDADRVFINRTFEDQRIEIRPGDKWISCRFTRCSFYGDNTGVLAHHCWFDHCENTFCGVMPDGYVGTVMAGNMGGLNYA